MTSDSGVFKGVVHGKTIELDQEPGLPEGQEVQVTVEPVRAGAGEGPLPRCEGLRRAFGAWAEDAEELDKYLEWNRQQRKIGRPEMEP